MRILWIIIKSRFTKPKEDKKVKNKREICAGCEYNSNNMSKVSTYKKFLASLSNFFSLVTGKNKEDNLGNCMACEACSIFYKTIYEDECPHPKEDKWKIFKNGDK